jgi:sortase A
MFKKAGNSPSGDARLRYSRGAVLTRLLGTGVVVGLGKPLELLSSPTGESRAAGGPGSPASECTAEPSGKDNRSGGSGEERGQREGEAAEAERGTKEKPPPPEDPTLYLYAPRLGIRGHTVREGGSESLMARGALKLPSTASPWRDGANPYIAGHRIAYPGRESYYQFYNLPAMRPGDPVYLRDAEWRLYEYRVVEKFAVSPSESWVTEPVAGEDLVTLQTCTDSVERSTWWEITPKLMQAGPDTGRLIVRAERV